jgi:hypothetical protein
MNDSPQPLWQELALPTEEQRRLYEEWVEQQEKKQREQVDTERVIVIDI